MYKTKLLITLTLAFSSIFLSAQKINKEKKAPKDEEGGKPSGIMPVLIRGPYLQTASPTSILIRWRTDASARSRVRYGTEKGNLDKMTDDSALVTEHKVLLKGMSPDTRYYYSIGGLIDTLQGGPAIFLGCCRWQAVRACSGSAYLGIAGIIQPINAMSGINSSAI